MGNIPYEKRWARKSRTFVNEKGQMYQEVVVELEEGSVKVLGYNHIIGLKQHDGYRPEFKCRYHIEESRNRTIKD